jgi:hypothetical protein
MKTTFTLVLRLIRYLRYPVLLAGILSGTGSRAQSPVTAVFTHWSNATTGLSYTSTGATGTASSGYNGNTYTYDFGTDVTTTNNIEYLDSFTAIGMNYHFQTAKESVYFRRVNNSSVTGLRKSLWFEQSSGATVNPGGTAALIPAYDDSLERLFSEHIFNIGIDNNFQNSTATNNNNIERVDVLFPGGVSATDVTKAGFVVFDRGTSGTHDPFYIAAVKTLDASGNPSTYYNAVAVAATNYGSNVGAAMNFLVLRENPGDGHLLMMNNTANQNRDGVLLRFTDLGVAANATIYGYSLFGTDVTVSPATDMVDYTNATNFPTNSNYTNGGIDQLAVTGLWVTSATYVVLADQVEGFGAQLAGSGGVQLSWTLGVADGLQRLVVQRSGNGTDFSTLETFSDPAVGEQGAVDPQPLAGVNYYRLELVDKDGTASYSTVCSVETGAISGLSVVLYPNPVQGSRVMLAMRGLKQDAYELRVLDMVGHLILQQGFIGQTQLETTVSLPAALPAGIYVLQLTDKSGATVGGSRTFVLP